MAGCISLEIVDKLFYLLRGIDTSGATLQVSVGFSDCNQYVLVYSSLAS